MPLPEISNKLKNTIKRAIDHKYDPTAPVKSINIKAAAEVNFDIPTDVEEERGWIRGLEISSDPSDVIDKGKIKIQDWSEIRKRWPNLTSGKHFLGVDGSNFRVKREQLHLLVTRSVIASYNIAGPSELPPRVAGEHMILFLLDKNLFSNYGLKQYVTKISYGDLKNDPLLMKWDPKKRAVDQSTGLGTRIRTLTEVEALEKIPGAYSEIDLILIDGLLYPPAIFVKEILDKYKKLDKKGYRFCSIVKTLGPPLFVQHLYDKKILKVDPDRYGSDLPFIRGLMKPLTTTPYFTWRPYGKRWKIQKEWSVLSTYFQTSRGNIFRLEMPAKYQNEGAHKEITKLVMSLSQLNYGGLPFPIEIADKCCGFDHGEEMRTGQLLDEYFFATTGQELIKPYGELF